MDEEAELKAMDQFASDEDEWESDRDKGRESGINPSPPDMVGVRTFFVFTNLPQHLEFRVGNLPVLCEGMKIDLDLSLRNPRNVRKVRKITGTYKVARRILKYSTESGSRNGLSQYLELTPDPSFQ